MDLQELSATTDAPQTFFGLFPWNSPQVSLLTQKQTRSASIAFDSASTPIAPDAQDIKAPQNGTVEPSNSKLSASFADLHKETFNSDDLHIGSPSTETTPTRVASDLSANFAAGGMVTAITETESSDIIDLEMPLDMLDNGSDEYSDLLDAQPPIISLSPHATTSPQRRTADRTVPVSPLAPARNPLAPASAAKPMPALADFDPLVAIPQDWMMKFESPKGSAPAAGPTDNSTNFRSMSLLDDYAISASPTSAIKYSQRDMDNCRTEMNLKVYVCSPSLNKSLGLRSWRSKKLLSATRICYSKIAKSKIR